MRIHWPGLIQAFDWSDRAGVDTATLKLLIAILLNTPRDADPHAVAGFWTTWSNSLYQLRLLDALLSLPPDTFNFVSLPGRRIVTVDDVSTASPTIKALAANVQGHTWNSLELFETLVTLGDSESNEIRTCVREMLDKAVKISAELVHMGLLQVSVCGSHIRAILFPDSNGLYRSHGMVLRRNMPPSYWPCFWQGILTINWSSCAFGRLIHRI